MFNNNSAQQVKTYETRQSTTNNIFNTNNTNTNNNIFSNNNNSQQPKSNIFGQQTSSASTANIFNQQTSNNNTTNLFNNTNNNNTQQPQQQQQTQMQLNLSYNKQQELINLMVKLHQFQSSSDLVNILKIIELCHSQAQNTIARTLKEGEQLIKENTPQAIQLRKDIAQKCTQIRNRNATLLQDLLNLRNKLTHQMYMQKTRALQRERELQRIMGLIKKTSASVKQKKNELYFNQQFNPNHKSVPKLSRSIQRPLVELTAATERLGRETMQTKEEFRLCLDYYRQHTN